MTARLDELGWSNRELARRSGVDANTIGDFLSGRSWPHRRTRATLEQTLGLDGGSIERAGEGQHTTGGSDTVTVEAPGKPRALVGLPAHLLERLTDEQLDEVLTVARAAAIRQARLVLGERGED